ncbi:MAG: hypothetical protein QXY49_04690 [Thermofilaceae archaeon]
MDVDLELAKQIFSQFGIPIDELKRRKLWELSAGTLKAFCTVLALASRLRTSCRRTLRAA